MHIIFTFLILCISNYIFCQTSGDKRIIITLTDTTNIYENVKKALIKNDFIIKEYENKDTVYTYSRELRTMPGYCNVIAIINNNSVTLSGFYGLKKMNVFGQTTAPRDYKPIIYFGGSKIWPLLESIAKSINGQIKYSK